jgi:hypothetical protein
MASIAQTWRRVTRNDQLLLFFLAVMVDAAAGYGALLFRLLTAAIQTLFLGPCSSATALSTSPASRRRCPGGMWFWRRPRAACCSVS